MIPAMFQLLPSYYGHASDSYFYDFSFFCESNIFWESYFAFIFCSASKFL